MVDWAQGNRASMSATVVAAGSQVNTRRRYAYGSSRLALAVSINEYRLALDCAPLTVSLNSQFLRL